MNWLILLYFIELGYSPFYQSYNILPTDYQAIKNENVYYIEFDAEIIYNHLFIGGSVKTYIQPNRNTYEFFPIQGDYVFKAGLRFQNLEIGFNHLCTHPVISRDKIASGQNYEGYEEFYIRISN